MSQQQQVNNSPLRLRNPTNYHLMAGQQPTYSLHPLTEIEAQHPMQQQQQQVIHNSRDSPSSEPLEFNDSFSRNIMNNTSFEYQGDEHEYTPLYDHRNSFSSTTTPNLGLEMHRRSSTATTDISTRHQEYHHPHHHQPVFIPGSLHHQDSNHNNNQNLAMSAPANMGYEYGGGGGGGYPTQNHIPNGVSLENGSTGSTNNMARSFEDDYTAQMNMQLMMEKRRRRRESHNAGK
ncbi:hypothetical protein BD770DRAFT_414214 [Pilaira anomala]|nr:hypothetical protein BD770DRAFT_414214 [Pilaira anomala]